MNPLSSTTRIFPPESGDVTDKAPSRHVEVDVDRQVLLIVNDEGGVRVPQRASHGCIWIPFFAAREVSKLLKLGTIVLVHDQVSFVSAKSWIENPQLKEAALLNSASPDYIYRAEGTKSKPGSFVIKKARSRILRAGFFR